MTDRRLVLVVPGQQNGEIVMRYGVFGVDTQSLFKLRAGPLQVSCLGQRRSQINVRGQAVGVCLNGLAKFISSLRIPARLKRQPAANQVYAFSLDQLLQSINERLGGSYTHRTLLGRLVLCFLRVSKTAIGHGQ